MALYGLGPMLQKLNNYIDVGCNFIVDFEWHCLMDLISMFFQINVCPYDVTMVYNNLCTFIMISS